MASLMTSQEIDALQVRGLSDAVESRHMEWWHLPIEDGHPPGHDFERAWVAAGEAVRDRLRMGFSVLIHFKGELGRSGAVACRLPVELGVSSDDAITMVRAVRPHTSERMLDRRHGDGAGPSGQIAGVRNSRLPGPDGQIRGMVARWRILMHRVLL